MPSFADFGKDSKDLLSKNYAEKGAWKIESKGKGPEKTLVFNPTAASNKPLSMDIEYNAKPIKTKTNITESGVIKPKFTYEAKPHKVETSVTYASKDGSTDFDVNYEFKNEKLVASAKYTNGKKNIDLAQSLAVASGISVGSGVTYNLDKPDVANKWNAGVYYNGNGLITNFTTVALKSWNFGVNYPVTISGTKVNTAFVVDNKAKWTLGGEGACFKCPGAKLRLRVNQDFTIGAAWVAKVAGGWKAAIAADVTRDAKFSWGTTFTLE